MSLGALSREAVVDARAGADDKETFKATMVDQNNRSKEVGEMHDIEGWTKFDFPGRGDKYSPMKWVSRPVRAVRRVSD